MESVPPARSATSPARRSPLARLAELDRAWRATLLVALAYAALCVAGGVQTGSSWDEIYHRAYGEISIDFYRTLGAERAATTYWTNYYGAFHALVGSLAERLWPSAPWPVARHMASVAFSLVGLVYCARLARLLAGPWAGFLAALVLGTTPRWTGDAMFNPIDVPTAGLYAASLYHLAVIAGAPERAGLGDWLRFGVAAGLTFAVRAVGLLLFPYAGLALVAWLASERAPLAALREHGARVAGRFAAALALAGAITFALWPRMWVEPVTTLLDTLGRTKSYPWYGEILFRGEYVPGQEIPRTYLLVWFWITAPPALWLGLVFALARPRGWLAPERAALRRVGLVLFALVFPPVYATLTGATIYDGIRHFLFLLPLLAALAAAGWWAQLRWFANGGRGPLAFGCALVATACAEPVVWYARSHPFEYTYFGPFAGGLARASHRFDTDYWGLSLRAAAEQLAAHRAELVAQRVLAPDATMGVMTNAPWFLLEPWLDEPAKYAKVPQETPDVPHQVLLLWYRTLPLGWEREPPATRSFSIVEGQVPFWQTYLVPRFTEGASGG